MSPATLTLPAIRDKPRYLLLAVCALALGTIAALAPHGCENVKCADGRTDCVPLRR